MVFATPALKCKKSCAARPAVLELSPDESGHGLSTMEANVKRSKKPKGGKEDIAVRACAPARYIYFTTPDRDDPGLAELPRA